MFQVSPPHLGFYSDPKHFIVNCEQNVVKFAEKWGKMYCKMQFLYKIFWQNKMLCISSFSELKPETHIHFFLALLQTYLFSRLLVFTFYQWNVSSRWFIFAFPWIVSLALIKALNICGNLFSRKYLRCEYRENKLLTKLNRFTVSASLKKIW